MAENDELLDEKRAREVLPMSTAWFHKQRCAGLPPQWCKVGRRVFYRRSDLDRFIAARVVSINTEDRTQ